MKDPGEILKVQQNSLVVTKGDLCPEAAKSNKYDLVTTLPSPPNQSRQTQPRCLKEMDWIQNRIQRSQV